MFGRSSNMNAADLDLYDDADRSDSSTKVLLAGQKMSGGERNGVPSNELTMDHNVKLESEIDEDLFNSVITERSSPGGSDSAGGASLGSAHQHITGSGTTQRKFSCYVGNLTWWTTDKDLVDVLVAAGINDVLDVKFYENRQNGQSKGFALVSFQTEPSVRHCMERLITRQIHGQQLVVLPYTKQSLAQFEVATRKPGDRPAASGQAGTPGAGTVGGASGAAGAKGLAGIPEPGKPGGPVFIGTFRIGMAPPSQSAPAVSMMPSGGAPPPPHLVVRSVASSSGPPPGAILVQAGPPPGAPSPFLTVRAAPPLMGPPPTGLPPGAQLILPPPGRPPPGLSAMHSVRISGPPPGSTILSHGMPPPGSHVNPNFYPTIAAAASMGGMPPATPTAAAPPPLASSGGSAGGGDSSTLMSLSEAEFEEIMNRNRTVSSSAISRAVSDASAGDFGSAIETLVTAISLIRQSKVAHDDRCKILISSLQDTLRGIEAKSFGGASGGSGGGSSAHRSTKERGGGDRRSRSRDRSKRRRDRTRSPRSRSRERFDDYSPRRRRY